MTFYSCCDEYIWNKRTYVYLWLTHADVWQKTTKFCKVIILQLKNKFKTKKKEWELYKQNQVVDT